MSTAAGVNIRRELVAESRDRLANSDLGPEDQQKEQNTIQKLESQITADLLGDAVPPSTLRSDVWSEPLQRGARKQHVRWDLSQQRVVGDSLIDSDEHFAVELWFTEIDEGLYSRSVKDKRTFLRQLPCVLRKRPPPSSQWLTVGLANQVQAIGAEFTELRCGETCHLVLSTVCPFYLPEPLTAADRATDRQVYVGLFKKTGMVDEASGRPEDSGEPKPPVKLYKYTVGGYFSGKTKTPFAITQGHKETLEWHVPADRFENGEDIDCDGGDYYMQLCSEARPMPGPAATSETSSEGEAGPVRVDVLRQSMSAMGRRPGHAKSRRHAMTLSSDLLAVRFCKSDAKIPDPVIRPGHNNPMGSLEITVFDLRRRFGQSTYRIIAVPAATRYPGGGGGVLTPKKQAPSPRAVSHSDTSANGGTGRSDTAPNADAVAATSAAAVAGTDSRAPVTLEMLEKSGAVLIEGIMVADGSDGRQKYFKMEYRVEGLVAGAKYSLYFIEVGRREEFIGHAYTKPSSVLRDLMDTKGGGFGIMSSFGMSSLSVPASALGLRRLSFSGSDDGKARGATTMFVPAWLMQPVANTIDTVNNQYMPTTVNKGGMPVPEECYWSSVRANAGKRATIRLASGHYSVNLILRNPAKKVRLTITQKSSSDSLSASTPRSSGGAEMFESFEDPPSPTTPTTPLPPLEGAEDAPLLEFYGNSGTWLFSVDVDRTSHDQATVLEFALDLEGLAPEDIDLRYYSEVYAQVGLIGRTATTPEDHDDDDGASPVVLPHDGHLRIETLSAVEDFIVRRNSRAPLGKSVLLKRARQTHIIPGIVTSLKLVQSQYGSRWKPRKTAGDFPTSLDPDSHLQHYMFSEIAQPWLELEGMYREAVEADQNRSRFGAKAREYLQKVDDALKGWVGVDELKNHLETWAISAAGGGTGGYYRKGMIFAGPPGTGKTSAARMVTKLMHEFGLVHRNKMIEESNLAGAFAGQTIPKLRKLCEQAAGGVLFVDEAYKLVEGNQGVAKEIIGELLIQMDASKSASERVTFIFAGYEKEVRVACSRHIIVFPPLFCNLNGHPVNGEMASSSHMKPRPPPLSTPSPIILLNHPDARDAERQKGAWPGGEQDVHQLQSRNALAD